MTKVYVTLLEGFLVPRCYVRSTPEKQEQLRLSLIDKGQELDFEWLREFTVEVDGECEWESSVVYKNG